jgi:hypothetical protein
VIVKTIIAVISLMVFYFFLGENKHHMDHIILVQDMIHLSVRFALHPHTTPALIQSYMHHPVKHHPVDLLTHLFQSVEVALAQEEGPFVASLGFVDGEFDVVVLEVF